MSLAVAVLLGAIFALQGSYPTGIGLFSNVATPVLAAFAALYSAFATRAYGSRLSTRSGQIWTSLTAGIVLWFFGEITWAYYTIALNVPIPYPSVADVFYLAGYVPLAIGFAAYVTYFRSAIGASRALALAAAVCISALAIFVLLLGPVLSSSEPATTFFFDFAYPLLDLVLLSLAVSALGLLAKGKLGVAWGFFTAGVLLNVFGDLLFSYTTLNGTYYNGSLSDLLFLWGYLAFALAFYTHRREL